MAPRLVYRRFAADGKTVSLRPMSRDDLDRLLTFVNGLVDDKKTGKGASVFTGFEKRVSRREEKKYLADQLTAVKKGHSISVLAEADGRIVGNGNVDPGPYNETRHHAHLGLTILADYRGKGIGREMVKVLLLEARRVGLKSIEVEFLSTNDAAIRTYRKAGFKEVGRIPRKVFRDGRFFDSVIMVKSI